MAGKFAPFLGWLASSLHLLSDAPDSFVNLLQNSFHKNEIEFGIVEAKKDQLIAPGDVLLDGYRELTSVDGHHGGAW